jgi:Predicted phosphoesterases, related to the Icc protein
MRFLVVTDIHGNKAASKWINSAARENDVDYVLMLGDITDFGPNSVATDIISNIKLGVYAIPGNCDPLDLPDTISEVAIDMHGRSETIADLYIVGLGGSNPTIFNTPFELSEDTIYEKLKPISKKRMVLMVHAPAYGFNDVIPSGLNVGSTAILKIVEEFDPLLVLSGHIHESVGILEKNGTMFINPGPAKDGMYAIVDIKNGKVNAKLFGPY